MKKMLNDLLYLEEHLSCNHYVSDYRCHFRYHETGRDVRVEQKRLEYNQLVFLSAGQARVVCNESGERVFHGGEIALLPRHADVSAHIRHRSRLTVCTFDLVKNPCDKLFLESCEALSPSEEHPPAPVPIRPHMARFLDQLGYYLRNGINCEHLHEIKQKEMFLIFKWFYPKEELARLFRPMAGKSTGFKARILENYEKAGNVDALARQLGMSRSNFDVRFKEEFGLPPGQWMLKQKAAHILHAMAFPDTTFGDVIDRFGFSSPSQFTRFCRRQFGRTPTEILTGMRAEKPPFMKNENK